LNPLFAKAFDFISQEDIATFENVVIQIEDGLKVIVSTANGKTAEASLAKFECHDKNIDIQVCVKGLETIAWKPREKCVTPNGDYNPEKDVRFFSDAPDMFFQLNDWRRRNQKNSNQS